jgi:hypothetical protein
MYLNEYANAYANWRYGTFNLPEELLALIGNKCYDSNGLKCEAGKTEIEPKDPAETGKAKRLFKELSTSRELTHANSPDDFAKASTSPGDYYYNSAEGGGVCVFDGSDNRVIIDIDPANYTPRNGYYRAEIVIENKSSNPDSIVQYQHFTGCDNYTGPELIKPGQAVLCEFPFYYDNTMTCPGGHWLYQRIRLVIKGTGVNAGDKAIIKKIKFYEVDPL